MNLKDKRNNLISKLKDKEYRHGWIEESIKMVLPYQIQANRVKRDWSQAILGKKADMKQNAVSRLESMDYGNLNINTLLRLAEAFDCGLLVKFVPFSRLVTEFEDVSPFALEVAEFEDDLVNLHSWDDETNETIKFEVKAGVYEEYLTETPSYQIGSLMKGNYSTADVIQSNPNYIS